MKKIELDSLIALNSIPFQYKERSSDYIINLIIKKYYYNNEIERRWTAISITMQFLNTSIAIYIGYLCLDDIKNFIFMSLITMQLSNSISNLSNFLTQSSRFIDDWENLINFWNNTISKPEPIKLALPDDLLITDLNISRGKFKLCFDINIKSLKFNIGIKILLTAKTGTGKSTFMDALTGKIPGITMNYGSPENYYYLVADMFQTINEKIPSSTVTIRNYFKDKLDDVLIYEYLNLIFESDELEIILDNLANNKLEFNKSSCPLDNHINEMLSGGQKKRLILATRCYEVDKYNKCIFILDEPEQGSDYETIILLLNTIFTRYKRCSVIMISHIHPRELDKLEIEWNYKLNINKGILSLV